MAIEIPGMGSLASALGDEGDGLFNFSAGAALEHSFPVVSVTGHEAISKLFRFEVTVLVGPDDDLSEALLQKPARLTFRSGDEAVRTVTGMVGAVEPTNSLLFDGRRALRFKLVPRLWLLKHRVTTRIFQGLSVPAIVKRVMRAVGLEGTWKLTRSYPARNYCVQYQESDLAFIKRLLAEEGIFYYFTEPGSLGGSLADSALGAAAGALDALASGDLEGAASNALDAVSSNPLVGAASGAIDALSSGDVGGVLSSVAGAVASFGPLASIAERVVFADNATSYAVIADGAVDPSLSLNVSFGLDGISASAGASLSLAKSLVVRDHVTQSPSDDDVFRASLKRQVKHERALLRDYDFHRPLLELRADASASTDGLSISIGGLSIDVGAGLGAVGGAIGGAIGLDAGAISGAAGAATSVAGAVASGSPGAIVGAAVGAVAGALGLGNNSDLRAYHHRGEYEKPEVTGARAQTTLEQHRRKFIEGAGTSSSRRLYPGARFRLVSDSGSLLAGEYTVTRVEHEGRTPELVKVLSQIEGTEGDTQQSYANRFECVPAKVPFRPKRPKPVLRQVVESATVVGPAGEEIYTDELGRIKVQFHWDLEGARNENSSCWIRVAHAWSGAGWGTQFIPRIGMEVLVTFLNGDQDCPVVTGCVYNGTHPPPFAVPGDKTRSGLRTQSSLGGDGFNELSFEDLKNAEQIYMHAQRDHDEVIERNHTARVGVDETKDVGHDQRLQVGNDRTEIVGGTRRERVALDQIEHIGGNSEETIEQDQTVRVTGAQYTVSLDAHRTVNRNATRVVGGNDRCEVTGMANTLVKDDLTTRVNGNCTTVVGKHDAKRTYIVHAEGRAIVQSSDLTEIASEKELILRVGATRMRITEERIELTGKSGLTVRSGNTVIEVTPEKARIRSKGKAIVSAESINILTDGAQVKLSDDVKITGSSVKLNPPKTDSEKDDDPKPPKPTKLDLKDQDGRPLANQRFVIHMDDGSEIAGVLDHEGRCELEIEGGGEAKVTFPEVSDVKSS